ncbi:MAG: type II secretion system minor pseudopilin GspJ [Acidiferrobacteraceae bacterium]
MKRPARGFTLLELLVAVAIFALVSAIAYEGLSQALTARRRLDHERRFWETIAITFAELQQDLAQALPRPVRNTAGMATPAFIGLPAGETHYNGSVLQFTRGGALPARRGPTSTLERIGYEVRRHTLVRLVWPVLDRAPNTRPLRSPLIRGVRQFRVRFYGANGQWSRTWPLPGAALTELPSGVRITLHLKGHGTFRRWFVVGG